MLRLVSTWLPRSDIGELGGDAVQDSCSLLWPAVADCDICVVNTGQFSSIDEVSVVFVSSAAKP